MTDKINWGPAIPTPNGRPSWLPETERVVDLETAAGWRYSERGTTASPCQWAWGVIRAIRLPADHAYYVVQRYNQEHGTDLVYWPGGDNPPEDWDGLGRLYVNSSFCDDDWPKHNSMRWNREGTCGDIIGYRRAAAPVEETDTVTLPRMTESEAKRSTGSKTTPTSRRRSTSCMPSKSSASSSPPASTASSPRPTNRRSRPRWSLNVTDQLKTDLQAIRDLLADPQRWTQGHCGRTAEGTPITVPSPKATCFCLMGAIFQTQGCETGGKVNEIEDHLNESPLLDGVSYIRFNDTHTHAEVLALLDERIAAL